MAALRNPAIPIGFVLMVLGFGNWFIGRDKVANYSQQVRQARELVPPPQNLEGLNELDARTNTSLLRRFRDASVGRSVASEKADFYRVVTSGGRLLILVGMFCAAAGLIHVWYRRRLVDRAAGAVRPA